MAELKKYDITTDSGYTTTLQLSDEDAKARGLKGKDTASVAAAAAKAAEAEKEAAARAAAEQEAADKAAVEAAAKAAAEKQAPVPRNKQAKPAGSK